jgi:hypothetical protein
MATAETVGHTAFFRRSGTGKMPIDASKDLSWQSECLLPSQLREEQKQKYPTDYLEKFQEIFQEMYQSNDLSHLHLMNHYPLETMPPVIYHARVQAKIEKGSGHVGKQAIKSQNKNWQKNQSMKKFLRIYQDFLRDFILPQFHDYGGILYQTVPTLRVVYPGSVAPVKPHKDADYWHDSNEINYWVPLVPVSGSNSLWSESEPGKGFCDLSSHPHSTYIAPPVGDFHSFDLDGTAGELMRFYGNGCQHYTTENETTTCRVSFDFRVIPASLFRLNSDLETIDQGGAAKRKIDEIGTDHDDHSEEKIDTLNTRDDTSLCILNTEQSQSPRKKFIDDESLKKLALRGAKPLLEGKYYSRMMLPVLSESMNIPDIT